MAFQVLDLMEAILLRQVLVQQAYLAVLLVEAYLEVQVAALEAYLVVLREEALMEACLVVPLVVACQAE